MKIDCFEVGRRKYANIYLAKNENRKDFQATIDELKRTRIVAVFIPGSLPVVDTLKRILSDY